MKKSLTFGAGVLMLNIATSASAAMSYIDSNGNTTTPNLIDTSKDAVYFSETISGAAGQYTVTNNTTDSYLAGFGISNNGTIAYVGNFGSTFGCGSNLNSNWCYESSNLDASNWGTVAVDFGSLTGQDIFGDISNVLDPGDNTLNFYKGADGELGPGDSWDQFLFGPPVLSSQLFAILGGGPSGLIYASGGQPINAVPVPAAVWLFGSGLLGLAGLARRKSA